MRRALLLAVLVLAGCGAPQELPKQAEEVESVAAEGALLAHEASEGTSATFVAEHAKALRGKLAEVQAAIDDEQLADVAADVERTLSELAASPGDEQRAAGAERKFDRLADEAGELAG